MLCKHSRAQLESMLNVLVSCKHSTTQVQCLALGTTKGLRHTRCQKCGHTSGDALIQICMRSNQCQLVKQRLIHGRIRDKLQFGSSGWSKESVSNNVGRAGNVLYVQVELS